MSESSHSTNPGSSVQPKSRYSLRFRHNLLSWSLVSLILALMIVNISVPQANAQDSIPGQLQVLPSLSPDTQDDLNPDLLGDTLPVDDNNLLAQLQPDQQLSFEVGLALPDQAEAESFVASLNDPASPNYHHYLTPEEYTARFNPSVQQENVVIVYLTQHGFQIVSKTPNRLLLQVSAPASLVERTFHTKLASFHHTGSLDTQEYDYVAPENQIILPSALRSLVSGVNLDSAPLQRMGKLRLSATSMPISLLNNTELTNQNVQAIYTSTSVPCLMNRKVFQCLTPTGLRQRYNLDPYYKSGFDGTGGTIALFETGDFNPQNIIDYAQVFGLPIPDFTVSKIGDVSPVPSKSQIEIEMDIEIVMAIAPKSHIIVYESPSGDLFGHSAFSTDLAQTFNKIVTDNKASVVSVSYGRCESGGYRAFSSMSMNLIHLSLVQGAAQGINFFVSSGDSGAYQCSTGNHINSEHLPQGDIISVSYPATDPLVIAVGGTQYGADGTATKEEVWSESSADSERSIYGQGSGGGVSTVYKQSAWQAKLGKGGDMRMIPDVSALAGAPFYSIFSFDSEYCKELYQTENCLIPGGGTSAASPLWAAATLLINQSAGKPVVLAERLYSIAATKSNSGFKDIIHGDNFYYKATPGYDMATGLGSADFTQLGIALGAQQLDNSTASTSVQTQTSPANPNFADTALQQIWIRTDKPVAEGAASSSTWLWGPVPQVSITEPYVQAQNGQRLVQYFDKGRLEINNPSGDRTNPYFATSGLLVKEMVSGNIQIGDTTFNQTAAANVPIAGDPDDSFGPTYASLNKVVTASPVQIGQPVVSTIDKNGNTSSNPALAGSGVTSAYYVPETKHSIASPFWNYLNSTASIYDSSGKLSVSRLFSPTFYVTGLPITEAYWAKVKVGGQVKDVLIQAFERRVLTYTPSNNPQFQVEQGNVGRAYFQWRYNHPLS